MLLNNQAESNIVYSQFIGHTDAFLIDLNSAGEEQEFNKINNEMKEKF